jgi:CubicO group peptidase (beta-lactamase class C family)
MSSGGGLSRPRVDRMRAVLAGHVDRGEVPGLVSVVSRGDDVAVEAIGVKRLGDDEPIGRDAIFRISSLTKPVTAVGGMILVEECVVGLDDPVDPWLPELADRRVMRRLDGRLDDTVPADRPITVRDLLTSRMGFGSVAAPPGTYPIQAAVREHRLGGDGPPAPEELPAADEYMRRLGSLPLIFQPGESWAYDTAPNVLGVLIERASGERLETFLGERVLDPLGMVDTGFSVPAEGIDRLTTSYSPDPATGRLEIYDEAGGGQWSRPPAFASGAGGLVSTVDDYLSFCRMLLAGGRHADGGRILSRPAVELMTTDQLTDAQRARARPFLGEHSGWGFGLAVNIRRGDLSTVPGRFGWDGGLGTSAYTDPREGLIGILMTHRPTYPPASTVFRDFWTSAYQAIDD